MSTEPPRPRLDTDGPHTGDIRVAGAPRPEPSFDARARPEATTRVDGFPAITVTSGPPYSPPARSGKGRRKAVWIAAGVGAVVVLGVTAYGLTSGDAAESAPPEPSTAAAAAAPWTPDAARGLAELPAVRYAGKLPKGDADVRLRLDVTRAGSATGTITSGAYRGDLVTIDGDTYLRAAAPLWRALGTGAERPDDYANRWTRATPALLGVDPAVLAPKALAKALDGDARALDDAVGGTAAHRVKTPRADVLVAKDAPYGLLGVQTSGHGEPLFTAAPLPDAAPVLGRIRTRVAALGGAVDPALRFSPGKLTFIGCAENVNGCTISVPARLTAPGGNVPDGARAALRATVTAGGRTLGACAASADVPENRSLVLRCTVTSAGWRAWMRRAMDTPGRHPYSATARVVGQAVAPGDVGALLTGLDGERTAPP
ncbi:hypothetical protein [Actinomadura flavalba]|uniref:hypothetical protein n=1 Tax=Actinomadura flavalba TaxID=1120938 RepID=UPI00039FD67B|nr:hypothetical protein [Actinomadura flavalba]